MIDNILANFAPLYWAAGLPVIPLKKHNDTSKGAGKAPILSEWTTYGREMPSRAMQDHWVLSYPQNNIGLPFGPASGLCAIDIDSEDQEVVDAILACLPKSPWKRVGKKGMGLIYKFNGQANFKLRDGDNQSIVEFLGLGNQMVMPPSIHPQTGKPYVSDTNLWEVLDKVVGLPQDIEKILHDALEPVLGERGMTLAHTGRSKPLQVVPQGERDNQLVRHAGYLARVVMGIDKNEKWPLAEALDHMYHWVEEMTATMSGDSMDPDKGIAKLLEFLLKDMENGKTLPDGWDLGLTPEQREHPAIASMFVSNEVARWDYVRARDWLAERMSEKVGDEKWTLQKAFEIIGLVGKDENFSEAEFGMLCSDIQKQLGKTLKISKPDMKKLFKQAREGDQGDAATDHEAIARNMIEEISRGGEIRHDQGTFWQWNGSCFDRQDDNVIFKAVASGVKGNALSRRHNDYIAIVKTIAILVEQCLGEETEPGINFANGLLDLNGTLHEHNPKYGKTYTMGFDYVPARAGECHKWLEFLEGVWGDDNDYAEKVAALQEAIAATMFGVAPQYQRAILLYGKAGAGKSVMLDVLREMMPEDAVCTIPPHTWHEKFVLPMMVGKTLNISGELPEDGRIKGHIFKQVVEGATQRCERKNKDGFEFAPIAAQWFAANHLPSSKDTSDGFMRRWLVLDFNKAIPESERIPNFAKILVAEERDAIAAWAISGLKRLRENRGYTLPPSHHARLSKIVRLNNSVQAWLDGAAKLRPEAGSLADATECYDQYVLHCKETERVFPVPFQRFMLMMSDIGFESEERRDNITDVLRYSLHGLKVVTPTVESKWATEPGSNVRAIR